MWAAHAEFLYIVVDRGRIEDRGSAAEEFCLCEVLFFFFDSRSAAGFLFLLFDCGNFEGCCSRVLSRRVVRVRVADAVGCQQVIAGQCC